MIEELNRIPETYLKHIENTDGLYEIRVQQGSDIFRIFCFFRPRRNCRFDERFSKKRSKRHRGKRLKKQLKSKRNTKSTKKMDSFKKYNYEYKK